MKDETNDHQCEKSVLCKGVILCIKKVRLWGEILKNCRHDNVIWKKKKKQKKKKKTKKLECYFRGYVYHVNYIVGSLKLLMFKFGSFKKFHIILVLLILKCIFLF